MKLIKRAPGAANLVLIPRSPRAVRLARKMVCGGLVIDRWGLGVG